MGAYLNKRNAADEISVLSILDKHVNPSRSFSRNLSATNINMDLLIVRMRSRQAGIKPGTRQEG